MEINQETNLLEMMVELKKEMIFFKESHFKKGKKQEEFQQPDVMNLDELISYVKSKGIPMSRSKAYKLSSAGGIPLRRAGNRLIFLNEEIDIWCDDQIKAPKINNYINNTHIIKSALKKQH